MKRILFLFAAAALALSACTKGPDMVGGHDNYNSTPGGRYMMFIADDLMAGALETLEIAREMGKEDVTWASRFSGMKIEKVSDNKWNLNFSGLFAFNNSSYQTEFTMTATSLNENKHANWEVTISGNRSEREGYRCTFESLGAITYQTLGGETGWSQLFGRLSMLVFDKDGKKDGCLLQLAGAPSQAQFVRGL